MVPLNKYPSQPTSPLYKNTLKNFTSSQEKKNIMGSEKKQEPILSHYNTPPKLSLPIKRQSLTTEAPTPPPRTTALSVPFKWEVAPGKPRPSYTRSEPKENNNNNVGVVRALELPPRLLSLESNKICSPTTVLEGPYVVGRAVSFTTSYRGINNNNNKETENYNFGSSRWGGVKNDREGSFDFSSWSVDGNSKVKITRVRRRGSFSSLSQGSSHFWASIYGSFKQVVPWKRRQEKQRPKIDTI